MTIDNIFREGIDKAESLILISELEEAARLRDIAKRQAEHKFRLLGIRPPVGEGEPYDPTLSFEASIGVAEAKAGRFAYWRRQVALKIERGKTKL